MTKSAIEETMNIVMDTIFCESYGKNTIIFENYREIYDLPIVKSCSEVSKKLYDYCLRKNYFTLLLIYDNEGKIFCYRNMSDKLYWDLPGGSIKDNETINQAINRIAKGIESQIIIDNVEPVAIIENEFKYKNQETYHVGIGFMAKIRNKKNINIKALPGDFIDANDEEISFFSRIACKKILEMFTNRYKEIQQKTNEDFQDNEIQTNEKHKKRYNFHNKYIKKYILTDKRKKKIEFQKLISEKIIGAESIIDISCGDDAFIFQTAKKMGIKLAVGNDISWSQVEHLSKKFNSAIFTNHNAASLPFKENSFDISYCSNTLHHMPNKKALVNMLESMYKISKKLLIIDIENPKETDGFPHLLNKYWYVKYLKDVGGAYLNENQFKIIIQEVFNDKADIKFSTFKNIMGKYMIAEITKKQKPQKSEQLIDKKIEIEQKFFCEDSSDLLAMLNDMDFSLKSKGKEIDEYFTDINSVYIKDRTCLRIRSLDNNKTELTFKGKSKNFSSFYAKTESNLNFGTTDSKEISSMLSSLGYVSYVVVNKNRTTYSKVEDITTLNVMIDHIEQIGNFVEFELICNDNKKSKEELLKILLNFVDKFKSLNFEKAYLPYRDFVAKSMYEKIKPEGEFKCLFLDLDGTLINSENVFFESFRKILNKHYNIDISLKDYEDNELKQNANLINSLKSYGKILEDVKDADIMSLVYEEYKKDFENIISEEESITNFQILKQLKEKDIKLGLVTTCKRSFINILLKQLDILNLFDTIIAREDVSNLKPAPDAYIKAMTKLNLSADKCIAIEDSSRGIEAAQKANLKTIRVTEYSNDETSFVCPEYDKASRILLIIYNNIPK
ncbi:MAG: HAD-IA family hydrolase [Bacteroidetes bacterium]|nr:HAD-IA family hydrolase [Bacteroidota bacterium]